MQRLRIVWGLLVCGLAAGVAGCGPAPEGSVITVMGSDTMQYLVNQWAESYGAVQPDVNVAVSAGGSGVGITALLNGNTDMCMASRELRDSEREEAKTKGLTPVEHTVALDGLAVIVNPGVGVEEVTLEQLKLIFTGSYKSWSELGGADVPIIVLSRESSSGTYSFFQEHVLDNLDYSPDARLLAANRTIVDSVAQDAGTVGYVGIGYAKSAGEGVHVLKVKADDSAPAILPSLESITDGTYSIWRPLYFYTTEPESDAVKAFVAYCKGAEGQRIVEEAEYIPVP